MLGKTMEQVYLHSLAVILCSCWVIVSMPNHLITYWYQHLQSYTTIQFIWKLNTCQDTKGLKSCYSFKLKKSKWWPRNSCIDITGNHACSFNNDIIVHHIIIKAKIIITSSLLLHTL